MKINRRDLLKFSGIGLAAAAAPSLALADNSYESLFRRGNPRAWPIVQGATDANSTSIIIMRPLNYPFQIRITDPNGRSISFSEKNGFDSTAIGWGTLEIQVQGLHLGSEYNLYLLNGEGHYFDHRTFKALNVNRKNCRFALVSCMDIFYRGESVTMWEKLDHENCDFIIINGDACYADTGHRGKDPDVIIRRYFDTRSVIAWFKLPNLTPTFTNWDDHDTGANNADRTYAFLSLSRELFRGFWGMNSNDAWSPQVRLDRNLSGVGSRFEAFGQRFYMMDNRTFRDPKRSGGKHWGDNQTEWLLEDLNRSRRPAWILNGGQYFGNYLSGSDSFEVDHKQDFQYVLGRLARVAAPVTFCSGDVHFSEIMRVEPQILGYETYEFTSSAMHSSNFPGLDERNHNPRRIHSTWRYNYMIFDVDVASGWQIQSRCVTESGRRGFTFECDIRRG